MIGAWRFCQTHTLHLQKYYEKKFVQTRRAVSNPRPVSSLLAMPPNIVPECCILSFASSNSCISPVYLEETSYSNRIIAFRSRRHSPALTFKPCSGLLPLSSWQVKSALLDIDVFALSCKSIRIFFISFFGLLHIILFRAMQRVRGLQKYLSIH